MYFAPTAVIAAKLLESFAVAASMSEENAGHCFLRFTVASMGLDW